MYDSSAPLAHVTVPDEAPVGNEQLARYGPHVVSFLIDTIIILVIVQLPFNRLDNYRLTGIVVALASFLYWALQIAYANGQTLGMRAVHIRCVNAADRAAVTFSQATVRTLLFCALLLIGSHYHVHAYRYPTTFQARSEDHELSILLLFTAPRLIDLLWAAWDKQNQTLHDKIGGTVVIKRPEVFV